MQKKYNNKCQYNDKLSLNTPKLQCVSFHDATSTPLYNWATKTRQAVRF
jgi:hypothetical protein